MPRQKRLNIQFDHKDVSLCTPTVSDGSVGSDQVGVQYIETLSSSYKDAKQFLAKIANHQQKIMIGCWPPSTVNAQEPKIYTGISNLGRRWLQDCLALHRIAVYSYGGNICEWAAAV